VSKLGSSLIEVMVVVVIFFVLVSVAVDNCNTYHAIKDGKIHKSNCIYGFDGRQKFCPRKVEGCEPACARWEKLK